ncbi:hypothetical protein ThesuDRAFT_00320 [Thermaerobacter subterraneus DSM 13965]|uniref:Uncharacterized protein n=1 Tax=Thermaerobacter subterraneus DSM 13965 TaxID=867903 RepID=K6PYB3_9FIRM|nr:hypothetical protein ThesuDRAFT_00320 [Thermaerobacter subterraneus DSM 13965]
MERGRAALQRTRRPGHERAVRGEGARPDRLPTFPLWALRSPAMGLYPRSGRRAREWRATRQNRRADYAR